MQDIKLFSVDSNILENPDFFRQYAINGKYQNLFQDFTLFLAYKKDQALRYKPGFELQFHLADFYTLFKIRKSNLHSKLPDNLQKELLSEGIEDKYSVFDFIFYRLHSRFLNFNRYRSFIVKDEYGKYKAKEQHLEQIKVIDKGRMIGKRGHLGFNPIVQYNDNFYSNSKRLHYCQVNLETYLNLTTPTGRPDQAARRLYLRMVWKASVNKKTHDTENFAKLCRIADFPRKDAKQNAKDLRILIAKVLKVSKLPLEYEVKYQGGGYQVQVKQLNQVQQIIKKVS